MVKRADDFRLVMGKATVHQRRALNEIHEKLKEYGYGLYPDSFNSFEKTVNRLSAWEL
jgi:hypothetical protein